MIHNNSTKSEKSDIVVVTVWYNRAKHVEKSIKSLFDQTVDNFSIFAVDDGSTDSTGEKLENMMNEAEKKRIPMRVWKKPNEGFTISLKRAIEQKSTSDIIAIHGAGDISMQERLEIQSNHLSNNNVVCVGSQTIEIDSEGNKIKEKEYPRNPTTELESGQIPLATHGTLMYKRKHYNKVGGYRVPFEYAQDNDLKIRLDEIGDILNTKNAVYKRLVSENTMKGEKNWRTAFYQTICTAAAIVSAQYRKVGKPDPIDQINNQYIPSLYQISKGRNLPPHYVNMAGRKTLYLLKERRFSAALAYLKYMGVKTPVFLPKIPRLGQNYIKKHI